MKIVSQKLLAFIEYLLNGEMLNTNRLLNRFQQKSPRNNEEFYCNLHESWTYLNVFSVILMDF